MRFDIMSKPPTTEEVQLEKNRLSNQINLLERLKNRLTKWYLLGAVFHLLVVGFITWLMLWSPANLPIVHIMFTIFFTLNSFNNLATFQNVVALLLFTAINMCFQLIFVGAFTVMDFLLILCVFVLGGAHFLFDSKLDKLRQLKGSLSLLMEAKDSSCLLVKKWLCLPEIQTYRNEVVHQGRKFFRGEILVMKRFNDNKDGRDKQREEKMAIDKASREVYKSGKPTSLTHPVNP